MLFFLIIPPFSFARKVTAAEKSCYSLTEKQTFRTRRFPTEKVILISIGDMRPDVFLACGNPYVEELQRISTHTFNARSVMPSLTLPCHLSMFHGVSPRCHGTDLAKDMTIPQFYIGPRFTPGNVLQAVSILNIAPTIAALMGLRRPHEWEGRSLVE